MPLYPASVMSTPSGVSSEAAFVLVQLKPQAGVVPWVEGHPPDIALLPQRKAMSQASRAVHLSTHLLRRGPWQGIPEQDHQSHHGAGSHQIQTQ